MRGSMSRPLYCDDLLPPPAGGLHRIKQFFKALPFESQAKDKDLNGGDNEVERDSPQYEYSVKLVKSDRLYYH